MIEALAIIWLGVAMTFTLGRLIGAIVRWAAK